MALETKKQTSEPTKAVHPLGKLNYILMAVCMLLIVIGFFMMSGSANEGDTFNYDIFEPSRTVVGPGLAFIGFVLMAFAIIYRPSKKNKQ